MHKVACVLGLMWFLWAGPSRTSAAGPAFQATRSCPDVSIPAFADWPAREKDAEPGLTLHVDVDGDGRRDSLEIALSSGSGSSSTFVDVELAGGRRFELVVEWSSYSMLTVTAIPPELLTPGCECILGVMEKAAFDSIEVRPDPSLEWLLAEPKSLHWIPGPPVLPRSYTVRTRDAEGWHWTTYNGLLHAYRLGQGPVAPVELARVGERVLLGTSHGVILTDRTRSRHAWVYITDSSESKLRHASIRRAQIVGRTAVITIEPTGPGASPQIVRIDLDTGRMR